MQFWYGIKNCVSQLAILLITLTKVVMHYDDYSLHFILNIYTWWPSDLMSVLQRAC